MAGALDAGARAAAVAHLDGCPDCRDLISLLARDATRDAAVDILHATQLSAAGPRRSGDPALVATDAAPARPVARRSATPTS